MINGQTELKAMLINEPGDFFHLCFITKHFMSLFQNENEIQDSGDVIGLELRKASPWSLSIV